MENFGNDFQTALAALIADGVTTSISVVSGIGAPAANFRIRVDDELMLVTSVGAGTNWTVTRGIESTAAMAHVAAATVTLVLTAGALNQGISDRAPSGGLLAANNLSDLGSPTAARGNLGLGTAALLASSAILLVANNLADVANVATAATNLGLGAASPVTHASLTVTGQLTSQVATGSAPLVVASTTQVANLNASQLIGATWAAPGAIGGTTPAAGAFTTLSASSTVSGTGFSTYLASPPAIGGTAAAAGTFAPLTIGSATQVILQCDTANVLSQRNGVNAQKIYEYNTFTDASNYERAEIRWNGNAFEIVTVGLGTGAARNVRVSSGGGTLVFATSGTDRWTVSPDLKCSTDNAQDIGSAGALRPRNIFAAGGVGLKVKAGALVDGDFTNPTDGFIAGDSTNSKIWIRLGGVWKGVVVA